MEMHPSAPQFQCCVLRGSAVTRTVVYFALGGSALTWMVVYFAVRGIPRGLTSTNVEIGRMGEDWGALFVHVGFSFFTG